MSPKPPTRQAIGGGAGFSVRPAYDSTAWMRGSFATACASRLASAVPPRIRTRSGLARENVMTVSDDTPVPWLSIVGIGEDGVDGLSATARGLLAGAELVGGGPGARVAVSRGVVPRRRPPSDAGRLARQADVRVGDAVRRIDPETAGASWQ